MPNAKTSDLNATRAAFMRRVSAPNINSLALKLAYLIAYKHMDNATGTARPSQDTLARGLAVSVRTVQRLLDILQPLGLVIVPGHGPGRAATYWVNPDKATPMSPINTTPVSPIGGRKGDNRRQRTRQPATEKATPMSPPLKKKLQEEEPREEYICDPPGFASPDLKQDTPPDPDRKTGRNEEPSLYCTVQKASEGEEPPYTDDQLLSDLRNFAHATRLVWEHGGNVRIDSGDDPEPSRRYSKEVAARIRTLMPKLSHLDQETLRERDRQLGLGIYETDNPKPKANNADHKTPVSVMVMALFDAFWSAYPRRVAKAQAERAFAAAVKRSADPGELIAGAKRYAAERAGQDPKFTKHPSTWLNADCHLDEPAPGAAGPPIIDQHGNVVAEPQQSTEDEFVSEYADPNNSWVRR